MENFVVAKPRNITNKNVGNKVVEQVIITAEHLMHIPELLHPDKG